MCRILYILNNRHVKKILTDFLQQSDHIAKYTPGVNSPSDAVVHLDGFGLAYFQSLTHRWKVMKTPKSYRAVTNLSKLLNDISVSPLIIGHIRKQSGEIAIPSHENTHPFYYRNQLFVHNGVLSGFECLSPSDKKKHIAKSLFSHIKGQTDSEWMFYLLLTVMNTYEHETPVTMEDMMILCVQKWLSILKSLFPEFNANVIYANKSHTIITRYRHEPPDHKHQPAPSLYFHQLGSDHKILISSEPLNDHYQLIPENTVIVIPHLISVLGHTPPVIMREL